MHESAIVFWVGMAGLLAVAVVLRRWHAEDMDKRIAETYGQRLLKPRLDTPVRRHAPSKDTRVPDAVLPEGAERASA